MIMTYDQRNAALKIYDVIASKKFADWYGFVYAGDIMGGDFECHILSQPNCKSKEEILQQICEIFKL